MQVIPFDPTYPEQTINVVLDSKVYILRFRWNSRFSFWTVDFSDIDGIIIAGIKILTSVRLLQSHGNPRLPAGDIVVTQNSTGLLRIERTTLGSDFSLMYMTEADLAAV